MTDNAHTRFWDWVRKTLHPDTVLAVECDERTYALTMMAYHYRSKPTPDMKGE